MSVTDIRISVNYSSDIKIRRLRALCGADGVLGLIDLWVFTALHRPDGVLSGISDKEIPLLTGVHSQDFLSVLLDLELLARTTTGALEIVNWRKHQTWVIGSEARSEKARIASLARWDKEAKEGNKNAG